jgi:deaminated glutathione amidase
MKIAVAQFSAGMDKAANLQRITTLVADAAGSGARLVVFPEAAMSDFGAPTDDLRAAAEPLDGPFVTALIRLASRHRLAVVAGMFERAPGDQRVFNTAVLVDAERGLVSAYRKQYLYDALGEVESDRLLPGNEPPEVLDIDGFRLAMIICYDMRFPSLVANVADRGAEVLLVPSAWVAGPMKEEHWTVLTHARAIENTMYVAAAGQGGPAYTARSVIVDPFGVTLTSLGEVPGVATADVSHERLLAVRTKLPVLAQRSRTPVAP